MDFVSPNRPGFPLAFGFVPTLQATLLFQVGGINLFWSSVFGLGGHAVEWIAPPHGPGLIDIFGVLVWPIIVWIGLYQAGERISQLPKRHSRWAMILYGLSLCAIAPLEGILYTSWGTPFKYEWLPLYVRLLAW